MPGRNTGADALILAALAGGASHAEAAREANVSESTVTRRLSEAGFREQLRELQGRALDEAVSRIGALALAATEVAAEEMADRESLIRWPAASRILGLACRLHDRSLDEVEARLTELERRYGGT